jgi:tetratricopeptide (TPR) repeat protein
MKKLCLAATLVLLTLAMTKPYAAAAESKTLQPTSQQKVIHDPKEFKTYMDALHLKDAAARGAAMEEFATRYPKSAAYAEALEQAMAAYQAAGDGRKIAEVAERLLKFDPKNVEALAILTYIKMNGDSAAATAEAKAYAERGLQLMPSWQSPAGLSKAQFAAMRHQTAAVFYEAIGLAALFAKDYSAARNALAKAVVDSGSGNFVDSYRLAVAELEPTPPDPQGFWYIAKSINLAKKQNPAAAAKIEAYAQAKYKNYHGSKDGWDALVASAAKERTPPKHFDVKPAMAR